MSELITNNAILDSGIEKMLFNRLKKIIIKIYSWGSNIECYAFPLFERFKTVHCIHMADILTPVDGEITYDQFVIVTRYLDIYANKSKIANGNYDGCTYEWQAQLAGVQNNTLLFDILNSYFSNLIRDVLENGYDYSSGAIRMSKNPAAVSEGTHRIAILYSINPNNYVPVKFFGKKGRNVRWRNGKIENIDQEDILFIEKQLGIMREKINNKSIIAFFIKDYYSNGILPLIEKFGEVVSCKTKEIYCVDSKMRKNLGISGKKHINELVEIKFILFKQKYYVKNDELKSFYIDKLRECLKNQFNDSLHHSYICNSVTESILYERMMNDDYKRKYREAR